MNTASTYPGFISGWRSWLLLVFFLGSSHLLFAQNVGIPDSLRKGGHHGLIRGGQVEGQGGPSGGAQKPQQKGQVNFQASDSLVFTFDKDRVATLYGSSSVNHTSGKLTAGKISMDLDKHEVNAETKTPQDTLSQPVLTRKDNRVRSNSITYNYKTEKGRFEVARTNVKDGQIIGNEVKKTGPNVIFLKDAIYSTCQLDHPHYYIKADRMKVVDQKKVFFTNARLYLLDIPYPLVFPFGYIPGKLDKHQSGLLQPTYAFQQKQTRGLGLQNLGWFQYFNDYLTGQASVDIFTSGTFFFNAQANYKVRDKLNGNIQIGFSRENNSLEPTDPGYKPTIAKSVSISHNQQFSPYASLSSSINFRTSNFLKRNSYDPTDRAQTNASSHISYRYRQPDNLYNFGISIQENQNFATQQTSISGPSMNFGLKRFSPFAKDQQSSQKTKWYQTLSINYSNSFDSRYNFSPKPNDSTGINWFEALLDPSKYREATGKNDLYKYGFRQQAGISMNKLIPSQFLHVTASANYNEYWYPTTIRKSFNPDSNRVETRQVRGFTTARDFTTSLNFSTTLYGLLNAHIGHFTSFRHKMTPSISFSYRPDFSSPYWGYYRTVQTDTARNYNGKIPTQKYSIFENQIYSGPGAGEQRSINFSLGNTFEAKQVKRDSTGEKKEKVVRLIDNLNLSTSYNFAADSVKLSDLNASLTAGILPGMDIHANATFNFYKRNDAGQKIDKLLISTEGKPFELTRFSTNTSYSFKFGGNGLQ
ncbi:MAG TPA: putative LPS assembly protein LptD, partial [Balneolaceae bacterium]|nr:putative LPS assembly protein LptD [Balneolaceae bacterium]